MRIMYTGMDNRTRVATANRVKYLPDGFQDTDQRNEREEGVRGPILIIHTHRSKGGRRLIIKVPAEYNMEAAMRELLEKGWYDFTDLKVITENLYQ